MPLNLKFLSEDNLDAFEESRSSILDSAEYNGYSEDASTLGKMLSKGLYQDVVEFDSINVQLSPSAHMFKSEAHQQLGNAGEAVKEAAFAERILIHLKQSGTGTREKPYLITTLSDERDILESLGEDKAGQSLQQDGGKKLDKIDCASGNSFYFNVTACMRSVSGPDALENLMKSMEEEFGGNTPPKKWWKFWK